MTLPPALLDSLRATFADGRRATGEAERIAYSYDNSRRHVLPDAVAFPTEHVQVEALVQACRAHQVPVITRGRGTNTTGATVPLDGEWW